MNFCTFLAAMLVINSVALLHSLHKSRQNRLLYLHERIAHIEHTPTKAELFALRACLDVAQPSEDDTEPCEIWNRADAALKNLEK